MSDEESGPLHPPEVDVGDEGFEVHVCQKVPKRGLLAAFDRHIVWKLVPGVSNEIGVNISDKTASFKWAKAGMPSEQYPTKTELNHFMLWNPQPHLGLDALGSGSSMIDYTNASIDRMHDASRRGIGDVTLGSWLQWLGVRTACSLEHSSGPITSHWDTDMQDGSIFRPSNFGARFGLSKDRFQTIERAFTISKPNPDEPDDAWGACRDYVRLFNLRRKEVFRPGPHLTFDESGMKWRGKNGAYHLQGCPHVTKCPRKPEPFNMELKNACDGDTGIMLVVEIQEGKERMAIKRHHDEMSNAASIVMRLCEEGDFCGSRRIVYGDSFFASWDMCNELMQKGLYFKGIVKQNSGGYPKQFFRDWWQFGIALAKENEQFRQQVTARRLAIKLDATLTKDSRRTGTLVKGTRTLAFEAVTKEVDVRKKSQNPHGTKHCNIKRHASIPRGQHIAMMSALNIPTNVGNTHPPIMAVGWADMTLKNFIGTCGHTLPGTPHERTTYKIVVDPVDGSRTQSKRVSFTARPQVRV
jgi:hypothetical protein